MAYPNISLEYKPGKELVLADTLSRSCPPDHEIQDSVVSVDPMLLVVGEVFGSVEATERYRQHTATDEELTVVLRLTQCGWPSTRKQCAARALPYWNLRHSLSIVDGLLFYGSRLVVPSACRSELVESLHAGHQGVTKTLQRARSSVFWPGLRKRLEEKCLSCEACVTVERSHTKEPLISMPVSEFPFEVVGIDPFEIEGKHYLAVVDYLTKWPVVKQLSVVQSDSIIHALGEVFAEFGIPRRLISDNGPQLTSRKFSEFLRSKGVVHATSSPLHASGNGQAERCIGTLKSMMKKVLKSGGEYWEGLLAIRNTPVDEGMPSPAQLLQGRKLRDGVPEQSECYQVQGYDLKELRQKLGERQSKQKHYHDNHSGVDKSVLQVGESVCFRTARSSWISGRIVAVLGDRSYSIESGGSVYRRNRIDIRPTLRPVEQRIVPTPVVPTPAARVDPVPVKVESNDPPADPPVIPDQAVQPYTTRSGREVRTPRWHQDYVM